MTEFPSVELPPPPLECLLKCFICRIKHTKCLETILNSDFVSLKPIDPGVVCCISVLQRQQQHEVPSTLSHNWSVITTNHYLLGYGPTDWQMNWLSEPTDIHSGFAETPNFCSTASPTLWIPGEEEHKENPSHWTTNNDFLVFPLYSRQEHVTHNDKSVFVLQNFSLFW